MKKLLVILLFIWSTAGLLSAQESTQSYHNTLKTMLKLAGTEESFKQAIDQMFNLFAQQYAQVPESVWQELKGKFQSTSLDELVLMLAPIYQKHLTESDLNDIIAFYQTPTGKKYALHTPLIMQESMVVGQEWGTKIGQQFLETMKERGY